MGQAAQHSDGVPAARWAALGVLFLVYLFNFVDRQILSILANDIKADLGIDDAQLGFLYGTAFAIFYAVFGIPLGWLADRTHRLRLLSAGLALWSTMTVLSGLAKSFGQLTLARVGVGVGEAAANPCAYSLIADWFPKRLRATALSIYSAGLFLGSGISLVVGGLIVDNWDAAYPQSAPLGLAGWQAAFILVGAPGLILAFVLLLIKEPARDDSVTPHGSVWSGFLEQLSDIVPPFTLLSARRRGWRALGVHMLGMAGIATAAFLLTIVLGNELQFTLLAVGYYAVFSWVTASRSKDGATFAATWGNTTFVAIMIAYSAICYIGYTSVLWAAPFAERSFSLSKTELGWLIGAANAAGGFLGVITGGIAADRLASIKDSARLLVPMIALLMPVPLILVGYSSGSITVFTICTFFTQMATASALGACAAASQALVKPRMRGTATAVFLLGPTMIGLAFGPFMAGYISEFTGSLATGVKWCLAAVLPGVIALVVAHQSYERD